MNPHCADKAVGGYLNYYVLKAMNMKSLTFADEDGPKSPMPAFIYGLSAGALQNELTSRYKTLKDPRLLSFDGSRHDAHQHYDLLSIVDHYFWRCLLLKYGYIFGIAYENSHGLCDDMTKFRSTFNVL